MGTYDFPDSVGGGVVLKGENGTVMIGLFVLELKVMLSGFAEDSLEGLIE